MSTNFTMVEAVDFRKSKKIAVRPFFDKSVSNMGLEKYNLSLFDGVKHEEQLACIENGGVTRYLTGLNEFAPDIKLLPEDIKAARINEIRKNVSELEKELAANVIDPNDPDFWNKVKLLKPDNYDFWNNIDIKLGNEPLFLDPRDPYDRIKIFAIEAGGFSLVAKSYEDAKSKVVPPKFYLDKEEQTVTFRTEYKKLRNKALAELQKLFDKNSTKLFYIAKCLDSNSAQYKKSTPNDTLYENMDTYINGEGAEGNKERAARSFIDAVNLDMETLKIKAIVKDCILFKHVVTKADGYIYHASNGSLLGRNLADIVEFLKNPLNEDILKDLNSKAEKYWNL